MHPFHKTSFRSNTLMGAEREPLLLLAFTCGTLSFTSLNLIAFIVCAALWFTVHPLLVWMAKHDPDMCKIYFRHILYPRYIPPFTTAFRKVKGYRIRT